VSGSQTIECFSETSRLVWVTAAAGAALPASANAAATVTAADHFHNQTLSALTNITADSACWISAVWGVTGASFILGLPLLDGVTAFSATTSIACVVQPLHTVCQFCCAFCSEQTTWRLALSRLAGVQQTLQVPSSSAPP